MEPQIVKIDGVDWLVKSTSHRSHVSPLCPRHHVPLRIDIHTGEFTKRLYCIEDQEIYTIPRGFDSERDYVIARINAKVYKGMKVLNLDDEALPIAKESVKSNDGKYFVTTQIMESKRGLQVVVYAGERNKTGKSQILISPSEKRLTFDHKDIHPSDIFTKLECAFDDGTIHTIKRGKKK